MKNLLLAISIVFLLASCGEDDEPQPRTTTVNTDTTENEQEGQIKFTLYSNRVPYIWKRVVNTVWVQDTIKTNHAVRYEPYDINNMGIGYFVTMNTSGQPTDSLHIKAEYDGKSAQMSSVKRQSFAFVKLDDLK